MKKICIWAMLASMAVEAAALSLYACTGTSVFSVTLSPGVFAAGGAALLLRAAAVFFMVTGLGLPVMGNFVGLIAYGSFLAGLMAWLYYIAGQVNYLASIFVGIDGTKLTAAFVLSVILLLAAWAGALVSSLTYSPFGKEAKDV